MHILSYDCTGYDDSLCENLLIFIFELHLEHGVTASISVTRINALWDNLRLHYIQKLQFSRPREHSPCVFIKKTTP